LRRAGRDVRFELGSLAIPQQLAVIYDQTQDGQVRDAEVCKQLPAKLGYELVAFEAFRMGDQDFSPQITKIRSLKPDAI
jgi:ABC-type branched-subunit amino acid transport system substrate-binding protein